MGDNQVSLELPALVLGDGHIAEFPKTGGNPIHHGSLVHQHIHHLAGLQNALLGLRGKGHRGVVPANCRQLLQGQCMACDQNFFHASASLLNCAFGRTNGGRRGDSPGASPAYPAREPLCDNCIRFSEKINSLLVKISSKPGIFFEFLPIYLGRPVQNYLIFYASQFA